MVNIEKYDEKKLKKEPMTKDWEANRTASRALYKAAVLNLWAADTCLVGRDTATKVGNLEIFYMSH